MISALGGRAAGQGGIMRRIFVSCGQESNEEVTLGNDVIKVIDAHDGTKGFFSQNVHSIEDLNRAVFGALQTCDGFFAVLHKRGGVTYGNYPITHRASVWIQQEIGILAYRSFLQGRHIPVRVYQEQGILFEGIMKTAIINPIIFRRKEEVLGGLTEWLRGPEFEDDPVLSRRESIFKNRIAALQNYDWILLGLIVAHSPEPGEQASISQIAKDFEEIMPEVFARENRSINNLLGRMAATGIIEAATGSGWVRICKPWWEFTLYELKNRGE
jgi:hypothetical protein